MKAYMQDVFSAAGSTGYPTTQLYNLYYMSGSVPQTMADVKSAVDLSDMNDLHSKSVGVSIITGTTTVSTTGIGSYSNTFTPYGAAYAWLKGGYTQSGTYYIPTPSRIYYESGRKSTYGSQPPFLFSMPLNCISNAITCGSTSGFHYRDVATAYSLKASGSEIKFDVEYDQATTISAIRIANSNAIVNSDYVYYATIDYWNGTAWVNAYTGASVFSVQAVTTYTFTAVTASKFRVILYPYSETVNYLNIYCTGVALMHTAAPATMPVADITWGIIVPTFNVTTNLSPFNALGGAPKSANVDLFNNPSMDSTSSWFGVATSYMPAVIDTCGQDSVNNKIAISQSTGLTSNLRPTLASYTYYLGEIA
jgi:hypothetical protein